MKRYTYLLLLLSAVSVALPTLSHAQSAVQQIRLEIPRAFLAPYNRPNDIRDIYFGLWFQYGLLTTGGTQFGPTPQGIDTARSYCQVVIYNDLLVALEPRRPTDRRQCVPVKAQSADLRFTQSAVGPNGFDLTYANMIPHQFSDGEILSIRCIGSNTADDSGRILIPSMDTLIAQHIPSSTLRIVGVTPVAASSDTTAGASPAAPVSGSDAE